MKPQHFSAISTTNESVESLDVASRNRIQTLKEAPANGSQFTIGWEVTEEVLESLQIILIAIAGLGWVPDPRQLPNLAVPS